MKVLTIILVIEHHVNIANIIHIASLGVGRRYR